MPNKHTNFTLDDFLSQAGHHDMSLEIRGSGIIASLIRNVVRGFNVKKRIKRVISNESCLPDPSKLPTYIILKIYGTYLSIWLMLLMGTYTQRFRRAFCAFFYRKREKRRILYIYNETLRKRLGYKKFMRNKIKTLVRSRRLELNMDPWLALKQRFPKLFGWLGYFQCARQKCLICEEVEPTNPKQRFLKCSTPGCPFVHCPECWKDVGMICYACTTDFDNTDSETGYDTQYVND